MAVVPEDDIPTVQEEPIAGRAIPRFDTSVSADSFGAGLGADIEKAGLTVFEIKQKQADEVRLAQANTDLATWQQSTLYNGQEKDGSDAAFRQTGPNAVNMPGRYLPQFDARAQEIQSSLTPRQQAAFAARVASQRDEFSLQLNRYEYEQGNRDAIGTFNEAKAVAIQSGARGYRDPESTNKARADLLAAGEALGSRIGLSKEQKAEQYGRDLDTLHESTVGAFLTDGNVQGAQSYFDKWKADLSSGTVQETIQNRITAAQDRVLGQSRDSARAHYDDSLKAGLAGLPGAGHLVSDDELQLLYKNDWQARRTFLDKASQTGAVEKLYDKMPPSEIQADLDRSKPTAAKPGVGDEIELWNMRSAAAQRSMARREADPRAFQISNLQQQPVDFSKDPKDNAPILSQRFASIGEDSERAGVQIPPLSKLESRQFAAQLDARDPAGQTQFLNAYRNGLGDLRFRTLMEQVRPDSPVIAKAGLLMPRDPDQAPSWYAPPFDTNEKTATMILRGQQLLNPDKLGKAEEGKDGFKGGIELPSADKFREKWEDFTRADPGLFAGRPPEADATFGAIKSYYAAYVADHSIYGAEIDMGAWRAATEAVRGPVDTHFVNTVPVPRGMDPGRFAGYVRGALQASEEAAGLPTGSLQHYALQELGPYGSGKYGLVDGVVPIYYPGRRDRVLIDLNQQYPRSFRRGQVTRLDEPPPAAATSRARGSSVGDGRFEDNPNENPAALEAANALP